MPNVITEKRTAGQKEESGGSEKRRVGRAYATVAEFCDGESTHQPGMQVTSRSRISSQHPAGKQGSHYHDHMRVSFANVLDSQGQHLDFRLLKPGVGNQSK